MEDTCIDDDDEHHMISDALPKRPQSARRKSILRTLQILKLEGASAAVQSGPQCRNTLTAQQVFLFQLLLLLLLQVLVLLETRKQENRLQTQC